MFFTFYLLWQWEHNSLQQLMQPWICAPGNRYGWVDQGSVEYKVYPTLLHMASTGKQTPDLLILNPIHLATCSHIIAVIVQSVEHGNIWTITCIYFFFILLYCPCVCACIASAFLLQMSRTRRAVTAIPEKKWLNAIVPYVIGDKISGE